MNTLFKSLTDDLLFKESLAHPDNRDFLEYVLENFLNLAPGTLHGILNVKYESPIKKMDYTEKGIRADLLVEFLDTVVNIEMFTIMDKEAFRKTMCYVHRLCSNVKLGDKYKGIKKVIQIVIVGNMAISFSKKVMNKYHFTNTYDKDDYLDKEGIEIQYHRLDKLYVSKYNENEEIIKLLKFIFAKDTQERKKLSKGSELYMSFSEWVDTYINDERSKQFFEKWNEQIVQNQIRREAHKLGLSEGRAEGLSQGLSQGKLEIAKNLLNLDVPIAKIEKATGLSEKKILSLK